MENTIKLKYVNGNIFVYDVEDWAKLRKTHRIIGNIVGNTSFIPSLPTKLLPEEALLLLNENLATIHENTGNLSESANVPLHFEEELLEAQQKEYKEIRRSQLEALIDKIVEKRRKLGDERSKEDIFNEELDKSSSVTKQNMLWPIFLKHDSKNLAAIPKEAIASLTTPLKSTVFKDLWEKGYCITSGAKFGGDFLVYWGDPIVHHAIFIVKCVEPETTFTPTEWIAFGRLGVSVKKRAVLASLKGESVSYVTINWIDA